MKILHTIDAGGIYGKERMLIALVRKQIAAGHAVHVVGFGVDEFFEEMIKYCYGYQVKSIRQFWNVISTIKYDVIHSHDYKTGIISAAWRIFNKDRKVIRTVHGYSGHLKPWTKLAAYEKMDRFMQRFDSTVVAVSDQLGKELNSEVILNGVDRVRRDDQPMVVRKDIVEFCEREASADEKPYVFCCMARLSKEKNLKSLISAIMRIPRAKLLLFGDGPLKSELKAYAESKDPSKVMFAGFDKHSRCYLKYVDAYIQPSLTEGLPISVLETLSCGIPMMTSKVGGMKFLHDLGVVSDSPLAPTEMSRRMIHFMEYHSEYKDRALTRGIAVFEKMFSSKAMYEKYQTIYQN